MSQMSRFIEIEKMDKKKSVKLSEKGPFIILVEVKQFVHGHLQSPHNHWGLMATAVFSSINFRSTNQEKPPPTMCV